MSRVGLGIQSHARRWADTASVGGDLSNVCCVVLSKNHANYTHSTRQPGRFPPAQGSGIQCFTRLSDLRHFSRTATGHRKVGQWHGLKTEPTSHSRTFLE